MSSAKAFVDFVQGRGPNITRQGLSWVSGVWEEAKQNRQCRYCNLPISVTEEPKAVKAYWGFTGDKDFWCLAHSTCSNKEELLLCKELDRNCNDCKSFQRILGNKGTCTKGIRSGEYTSWPVMAESNPCWEMRGLERTSSP